MLLKPILGPGRVYLHALCARGYAYLWTRLAQDPGDTETHARGHLHTYRSRMRMLHPLSVKEGWGEQPRRIWDHFFAHRAREHRSLHVIT
jgi:hypothetical protein